MYIQRHILLLSVRQVNLTLHKIIDWTSDALKFYRISVIVSVNKTNPICCCLYSKNDMSAFKILFESEITNANKNMQRIWLLNGRVSSLI